MALNVGELVWRLSVDGDRLNAGLADARTRLRGFGDHAKAGLKAAGLAGGALLAAGVAANLDIGAGRARLAAQMDLTSEDSARIGSVAGQVYADNWGESLDHVNEAIRAVGMNLGDITQMSDAELQQVTTSALALSQTFGVDLTQAAEAAGKMVTNGLAANSQEAFDILTAGFQGGLDRSDDFLETMNEYAPQFKKLGIDGGTALGILQAGLKAGARDTDVIADAFKEFSIRAIDGSNTTIDAYESLGLSAAETANTIAKGGPAAEAMTQQVIRALASVEDPVERDRIGVELFGTTWEDTLSGILPAMTDFTLGALDTADATERMADTAGDSGAAKIETLKRGMEQWVQSQTSSASALGTLTAGIVAFGGPALAMAGTAGQIAAGLAAFNLQSTIAAAKAAIVATGTKVWAAAQWVLNSALFANPIGLVVLAIAALVGAVILAWKNSETFRTVVLAAWEGIKVAARAVFGWISGWIKRNWDDIKRVTSAVWSVIKAVVSSNIESVKATVRGVIAIVTFVRDAWNRARSATVERVGALVSFVRSIPRRILSALGNLSGLLRNAGYRVVQGFINGITAQFGRVRAQLNRLTSMIPSWKGPKERDRTLLAGPARDIMHGFADSLGEEETVVHRRLSVMTDSLPSTVAPSPMARIPTQRSGEPYGTGDARELRLRGSREMVAMLRAIVSDFGGGSVTEVLDS